MDGNQDNQSNIENPKELYNDIKNIANKWDFQHRWNYGSNLILYKELRHKYPFITYSYIKAIAKGLPLFCKNCGKLLKDTFCKSQLCKTCSDKSNNRAQKIKNSKHKISPKELKDSIEKRRKTTFKKYGVYNISQSPQVIEKIKKSLTGRTYSLNKETVLSRNIQKYITHKKNNSFKSSMPEEFSIFIIKEITEVISHYSSKKYPFECDLYLPKYDLYIELNYSWTHGGHPFNQWNEKDCNKIKEIENLAQEKAFYHNMLETWTERDPLKRETARKNNLNYLEFFTFDSFLNWFWLSFYNDIIKSFPHITKEKLKKAYLCYIRSGNPRSIPNFIFKDKLIVKNDIKEEDQFYQDWKNKDKRLQVIRYMLKFKVEGLAENYLSNFATCFLESGITYWR